MTVTGSATATYTTVEDVVVGNPLGMATGLTFTGSGELDNGSTFTVSYALTNKAGYTGSAIAITTPSLGTFKYDEGGGTGLDRIDDMMPTAWEEVDGTGVVMGLRTVTGAGANADIEWTVGLGLPEGMAAYIAVAPQADGSKNTNKAYSGANTTSDGYAWDIVLTHNGLADGLNVFGGYGDISQNTTLGDRKEGTIGATYAIGGITLGYQFSKIIQPGAADTYYENQAYGVSFAINDDLTVSYAGTESKKAFNSNVCTVELDGKSLQLSYSFGGASIKVAEASVDNKNYLTTAANQRDGRTIALTLAF
jgi:outer membrane protein OmpU